MKRAVRVYEIAHAAGKHPGEIMLALALVDNATAHEIRALKRSISRLLAENDALRHALNQATSLDGAPAEQNGPST